MKRFHLHIAVADLAANIRFYSQLFGTPPTTGKTDYAKWMLDDPRINFAISERGAAPGLDHIGIQVDSEEELAAVKMRYDATDASSVTTETGTACCYVESNKHWLTDPQGIAWEAFHSLSDIPTFSGNDTAEPNACCTPGSATASASSPTTRGKPVDIAVAESPATKCC
jgi:hypothetical protein